MDPREYVDARWSALVRAAVLLGAPESEAPQLVRQVLAAQERRIRRADDPDPLVHRALAAAIPGAGSTAFAAQDDPVARHQMLIADEDDLIGPAVPPPPRPAPRRRARALVVAGLATALLVAAVVAYGVSRDRPGPSGQQDTDVLRADQVPSLFGYAADDARTMLSRLGLDVTVEPFRACEVMGRVTGTDPATGTTYHRGDPITVYSAVPSDVSCLTDYQDIAAAWQLIDFANGRGTTPPFARRVIVYVGDGPGVVVTHAGRPSQWGSTGVLAQVRTATSQVALDTDAQDYALPTLGVGTTTPRRCGAPDPPVAGRPQTLTITIGAPDDRTSCPLRLDVFRDGGRIDAVALYPSLS